MAKRGQNEGTIYKRSDGRWEARVTLDLGKRKSHYAKTRQEAARWLAATLRAHDQGVQILTDERQTVAQYLARWLDTVQPTVKPRTSRRYEQLVRVHIAPSTALGAISLSRLSPQRVQRLWAEKLMTGCSPTTVHHMHAVLHKALEDALRLGLVPRNVTELVDPPRLARTEMHVLSPQEAERLLNAADGDRLKALYVLALTTGMRQGELLALRWRQVDLEHASLQVTATLYKHGPEIVFAEPKPKQSRRKVRLTSQAVTALREQRIRQHVERLEAGPGWMDLDLVFCNSVGRPLDQTHLLRRAFYPLLVRAGLPRIRFHDLRHTAATLLLLKHVPTKVVSELLGHASTAITSDLYSHVTPDMQDDAVSAMEAIFRR